MENKNRIKLNVGGTIFETTKQTLVFAPYFKNLFFTNWSEIQNSQNNPIFIDRDPTEFKHILRLLRDPNYIIPRRFESAIEFYGICEQNEQNIQNEILAPETNKPNSYEELFGDQHISINYKYKEQKIGNDIDTCKMIYSSRNHFGYIYDKLFNLNGSCNYSDYLEHVSKNQNIIEEVKEHVTKFITQYNFNFKSLNSNYSINNIKLCFKYLDSIESIDKLYKNIVDSFIFRFDTLVLANMDTNMAYNINQLLYGKKLFDYKIEVMRRTGTIIIDIPFSSVNGFNILNGEQLQFDVNINNQYLDKIEDPYIEINGNYKIKQNNFPDLQQTTIIINDLLIFDYMILQTYDYKYKDINFEGLLNGMIICENDYKKIKNIKMYLNSTIIRNMDELSLYDEMYKINLFPKNNVYYVSFGHSGIEIDQNDNFGITIEFYEQTSDKKILIAFCKKQFISLKQ
jgi:hypothetical protein